MTCRVCGSTDIYVRPQSGYLRCRQCRRERLAEQVGHPVMARGRWQQSRLPWGPIGALGFNDTELTEQTGMSRRAFVRWRRDGIPAHSADILAVRLGAHPAELWGDRWWELAS